MKIEKLSDALKKQLLNLFHSPEHTVVYRGSGMGNVLRAKLVAHGWVESINYKGNEALRLTVMGTLIAAKLDE